MRNFLLFSALLMLMPFCEVSAQGNTTSLATFGNERINMGTIQQGEPQTVRFSVVSTGMEPVQIRLVKPECGCTSVDWPKELLMPGEAGFITVTFDAAELGDFDKWVMVKSNASNAQDKLLTFYGTVVPTK